MLICIYCPAHILQPRAKEFPSMLATGHRGPFWAFNIFIFKSWKNSYKALFLFFYFIFQIWELNIMCHDDFIPLGHTYDYNKIILNLYKSVNWIVNSSWSDQTIFFKIFFFKKKLKIKYILIELSKLNCTQLPSNLIWKPTWINIRWTNNKMNLYSRTGLNNNCVRWGC